MLQNFFRRTLNYYSTVLQELNVYSKYNYCTKNNDTVKNTVLIQSYGYFLRMSLEIDQA